jgi:hypothetical protein
MYNKTRYNGEDPEYQDLLKEYVTLITQNTKILKTYLDQNEKILDNLFNQSSKLENTIKDLEKRKF